LFVFTQLHNGIKLYLKLLPSYETTTNPRSTVLFRTGRYILNTNQQYKHKDITLQTIKSNPSVYKDYIFFSIAIRL